LASQSTTVFKHVTERKYHTLCNKLSKMRNIPCFPFVILSRCETQAVEVKVEDFLKISLRKEDIGHKPKAGICHISQTFQVLLNISSKLINDTVNLFMTVSSTEPSH
jgi:hypothetical protein